MKQSCSAPSKHPRAKRVKKPKHRVVTRAFDFPMMDVTAKQNDRIWMHLGACWRLRNILVADRIENRASNKLLKPQGVTEDIHYLSQSDQYTAIHEYVHHDTALSKVHSQVRQNVAVRVDEGYQRFFEALKEGRTSTR